MRTENNAYKKKYYNEFVMNCIRRDDGMVKKAFIELYEKYGEDPASFIKELVKSENAAIKQTQAYAVASHYIDPDGQHWKRLRAIIGDRCKKTYSDNGCIKVGNDTASFYINTGGGKGDQRYAVMENQSFNTDMLRFVGVLEGSLLNIYSNDKEDTVLETLNGKYGIYCCQGIVILEEWK